MMEDPKQVHEHRNLETMCEDNQDLGWFFWDETGGCHGPFETRDEAVETFNRYCEEVL